MPRRIEISIARQTLVLLEGDIPTWCCPVATARNGPGEIMDSGCTPRGMHQIAAKIGNGCPPNTVFVGRRPSGEIWCPALARQYPDRDWILSRILWLSGLESGRNLGGPVDSKARFIYIHGCPDTLCLGTPSSGGCIRVHSQQMIHLFPLIEEGSTVLVTEH